MNGIEGRLRSEQAQVLARSIIGVIVEKGAEDIFGRLVLRHITRDFGRIHGRYNANAVVGIDDIVCGGRHSVE